MGRCKVVWGFFHLANCNLANCQDNRTFQAKDLIGQQAKICTTDILIYLYIYKLANCSWWWKSAKWKVKSCQQNAPMSLICLCIFVSVSSGHLWWSLGFANCKLRAIKSNWLTFYVGFNSGSNPWSVHSASPPPRPRPPSFGLECNSHFHV